MICSISLSLSLSLSLSPVPKIRMLRMISSVHKTVLTLLLLVVFTLLLGNCGAKRNDEQCENQPSPCRNILKISYPFRLKGDPKNCGKKKYELYCEGNRTVVDLFPSAKYYVQAIDYKHYTIRLVDVGLQLGNCSSLPLYHLSLLNFTDTQENPPPYLLGNHKVSGYNIFYYGTSSTSFYNHIRIPWDIAATVLVNCEKLVTSPLYTSSTTASSCLKQLPTNKSNGFYSYVLFGSLRESNVADRCRIDEIVATTLWLPPAKKEGIADNSSSFLDFHSKLAYGFELLWVHILCDDCQGDCFVQEDYNVTCYKYCDVYEPNNYYRHSFRCRLERIFYKILDQVLYIHRQALINTGLFLGARYFCGILSLFAFLIYKFKRRHLSMFDAIEGFLQSQDNYLMPIRYSYFQIRQMTKGFKDKLGEGGFGSVYKGKLRSGHVAAIKVLEKSNANGQDFINEVATIGRIHHVNVVRLIGFCATRSKRALVYEYMPNGSLEKYLFSQEVNASLSCTQMHQICLGVARGIEYLHQGCDMQILHFDIKPHNILLDENFNPKVSDFGLAKLYPIDHSMVSMTAARGTMGYMAPELFYKNIGRVSYKADVYSYGMLLMEMAGRRRNLNAFADHTSQIYFPSWIYDQFKEGKEMEMEEACTEEEREMARKMVIVALWCIQMNPGDRPSMSKVVEMLEGNVEALEMPPKPFFTPQDMPTEDD